METNWGAFAPVITALRQAARTGNAIDMAQQLDWQSLTQRWNDACADANPRGRVIVAQLAEAFGHIDLATRGKSKPRRLAEAIKLIADMVNNPRDLPVKQRMILGRELARLYHLLASGLPEIVRALVIIDGAPIHEIGLTRIMLGKYCYLEGNHDDAIKFLGEGLRYLERGKRSREASIAHRKIAYLWLAAAHKAKGQTVRAVAFEQTAASIQCGHDGYGQVIASTAVNDLVFPVDPLP